MTDAEALAAYHRASLHELGRMAFEMTCRLHPEDYRTYVVDRNINYSNLCTARCLFCNFGVSCGDPRGYVHSLEHIGQKIEELLAVGGTQILMQGGLVPPEILPFGWYEDLLRYIKKHYPTVHVHAFSPPEIYAFSQGFGMSIREVLLRLREAGLDTVPGGGAEILVDRVREKISPGKTRTADWLEVMRQAHRLGMKTSATMMFGHLETIPERVEHLRHIRQLQDETGGFVAFILWPFQAEGTILARTPRRPAEQPGPPDGERLLLAEGCEYLRMLALSRLYLHNVPNIQSSWVTMGPAVGQLALFFGANDMGSVMMEEKVVSSAGTAYRLNEAAIARLIADAGWRPQRRDQCYRCLEAAGPPPRASATVASYRPGRA